MITIYKVVDYDGEVLAVKSTTLSLKEKKEEIINNILTNKNYIHKNSIQKLITNYNEIGEDFLSVIELEKIKEFVDEDIIIGKIRDYRKRCTIDNFRLKEDTSFNPDVKGRKLKFYDSWIKHSRPSVLTNANNEIIKQISEITKIDIDEVVDIIRFQSMFVIENTKKNKGTKIPIIGTFRKSKKIRRRELGSKDNSNYDFIDYICS